MTINDNKEDLRQKSCHYHKSTRYKNALAMMCGRDEEPQPNIVACSKITMAYAHCRVMDMRCQ